MAFEVNVCRVWQPLNPSQCTSGSNEEDERTAKVWDGAECTRLPPMWPGFDSHTRRHMWVEFVGSLLCTERFFSGYSGFLSPQKPTFDLICVNC